MPRQLKSIVWDFDAVHNYLMRHGVEFARIKTPKGWPTLLRKQYSEIRGKCFRNALFMGLHSRDTLYYCEGYAKSPAGHWHPHAWTSPKHLFGEEQLPNGEVEGEPLLWAIDPTWGWKYNEMPQDCLYYTGIVLEPHVARDFIFYIKRMYGSASTSVLKYVDHLPQFLNCLH